MDNLPAVIPHNQQAEQAILGTILSTPALLDRVIDKLYPDDFFDGMCRSVYTAIVSLNESGESIDALTLEDYLNTHFSKAKYGDDKIVWAEIIAKIIESVEAASSFMSYVKIVIEKSIARSAHNSYLDGIEKINNGVNISSVLGTSMEAYYTLMSRVDFNSVSVEAKEGIDVIVSEVYEAMNKGEFIGLSTNYKTLDKGIGGGFGRGEVIVIAARPEGGKTALATSIAIRCAQRGVVPLMFSLEMSKKQIQYRIISYLSEIAIADMKTGNLNKYKWERLVHGAEEASKLGLIIDQSPSITIETIIARSRAYINKHKCGIMFVDYLQLLRSEHKYEKRVNELSYITARFKQLSKELDIPIVLLAQLNRNMKARQDPTPVVEDLKDSGSIEQDADIVLLMDKPVTTQRFDGVKQVFKTTVDIIVGKNRNGGARDVVIPMHFKLFCGRFEDDSSIEYDKGERDVTQSRGKDGQYLWQDDGDNSD